MGSVRLIVTFRFTVLDSSTQRMYASERKKLRSVNERSEVQTKPLRALSDQQLSISDRSEIQITRHECTFTIAKLSQLQHSFVPYFYNSFQLLK